MNNWSEASAFANRSRLCRITVAARVAGAVVCGLWLALPPQAEAVATYLSKLAAQALQVEIGKASALGQELRITTVSKLN